jgi:hypothetical protein
MVAAAQGHCQPDGETYTRIVIDNYIFRSNRLHKLVGAISFDEGKQPGLFHKVNYVPQVRGDESQDGQQERVQEIKPCPKVQG